ncbi:MAG: thiamine pyrophosphate-dependent dehydrogenase E1 component subunit alpha [Gammaproteobacteria bacterium]|nr:thiamine pyrophosphate-dependent dehydrogenase E1 component subunit alpha [Gammaproteobacteria bacterium]
MIQYRYQGSGFADWRAALEQYTREQLLDMFFQLLRIRRVEESIESRYHEDEMKTPIHLVIGQEASCVGVCGVLTRNDLVYCGHRTHGVYLAKGGDLKAMMSECYCRANGCAGSKGGSMHLLDKNVGMAGASAIVAGIVPIATGAALTAKMRDETWVSVVFFGDAATEEGAMWESLNFAALKRLPVIYICENNYFSVYSPLSNRQPAAVDIFKKAESFGLNSHVVDGTNVLAVREAMTTAIGRARSGEGPSFIETRAYRWRGHGGTGDDSASGYRDPDEVTLWQQYCPVELFSTFLTENKILDASRRQAMETHIDGEISAAFEFAINSAMPTERDLYAHVYSD